MNRLFRKTVAFGLGVTLMMTTLGSSAIAYDTNITEAPETSEIPDGPDAQNGSETLQNTETSSTAPSAEEQQAVLTDYETKVQALIATYRTVVADMYADALPLEQQLEILMQQQDAFHNMANELRNTNLDTSVLLDELQIQWQDADLRRLDTIRLLEEQRLEEECRQNNRYANVQVSSADRDLMAKILYLEANNQSTEGQQAVVEVILNRVVNSRFPNSVQEVIYQQGQFTSVKVLSRAQPSARTYEIVDQVLAGETNVVPTDVVYFSRGKANNRPYQKIGDHWFCYI